MYSLPYFQSNINYKLAFMNYLSFQKLFPSYFREVGYISAIIFFIIALVFKFQCHIFPDYLSLRLIQTGFLISLFFIISTKSKTEDERSDQLRLSLSALGFYLLIFYLIILEIFGYLVDFTFTHRDIFDGCLVYLLCLILLFEGINRTNAMDKIESNEKVFKLIFMIIFILLLFLNKWFWDWTYPSIAQ